MMMVVQTPQQKRLIRRFSVVNLVGNPTDGVGTPTIKVVV